MTPIPIHHLHEDAPRMSTASIPLAERTRIDTSSIVKAGASIGLMDLLLAFVWYVWIRGVTTPVRVLQSIAAGVLGKEARQGGLPAAALGAFLHFVIAFIWAAIFYFALQRSSLLKRLLVKTSTAVTVGLAFGVVIWAGMRYIVVPLSAAGNGIPTTFDSNALAMLVGHAVLLGLPAVLIIRRGARR